MTQTQRCREKELPRSTICVGGLTSGTESPSFSSQFTWQTLPWLPAPWDGTTPTQSWAQCMSFRSSRLLSTFNPLRRPFWTLIQLTILTVPKPCKSYPLSVFNDWSNRGYKEAQHKPGLILIQVQGGCFPALCGLPATAAGACEAGGGDSQMFSYLPKEFIVKEKDIPWAFSFTFFMTDFFYFYF